MRCDYFSILGDSYSTFRGYVPKEYACYYPNPDYVEDVLHLEDTWWYQFAEDTKLYLQDNDSYSGATVCTDLREGYPKKSSFVARVKYLTYSPDKNLKYVIVFGATNDFYLNRELGDLQFCGWSDDDLRKILPAYCYVLEYLSTNFPGVKIVSVINTEFSPELHRGMLEAGRYYNAVNVELKDIDKQIGHPTKCGMTQIAQQIEQAICKKTEQTD